MHFDTGHNGRELMAVQNNCLSFYIQMGAAIFVSDEKQRPHVQ